MPPATHLTPDIQLDFTKVSDAQISPDGSKFVFVLSENYVIDTANAKSNLWVVPTDGSPPRQLTSGPRADVKPRWSPDGLYLAFLSDRAEDGQMQIYLLSASGGEAIQLTDSEGEMMLQGGVPTIEWSPDGKKLAYMKVDSETEAEKRAKAAGRDEIEFEKHPKWMRLYVVDIETRETVTASPDRLQVWDFGWSPDGEHFAAAVSDLPFHDY